MKTIIKTIVTLLVVLGIIVGAGYYVLNSFTSSEVRQISEAAEQADEKLEQGEAVETVKSDVAPATVGMEEWEFQVMLHQMTHQKITASEKRGEIEMTPENIGGMLKIARANEGAYEEYEFYEKSLTAWEQGDFSNAVGVHNTIWEWHNGNVGRATGLMSKEQEKEFVEKHFR